MPGTYPSIGTGARPCSRRMSFSSCLPRPVREVVRPVKDRVADDEVLDVDELRGFLAKRLQELTPFRRAPLLPFRSPSGTGVSPVHPLKESTNILPQSVGLRRISRRVGDERDVNSRRGILISPVAHESRPRECLVRRIRSPPTPPQPRQAPRPASVRQTNSRQILSLADLHVDNGALLGREGNAELSHRLSGEVVLLGVVALVDLGKRLWGCKGQTGENRRTAGRT